MVPARAPKTYSILLADPLTLVREALAALCQAQPQYRVVDQCGDGAAPSVPFPLTTGKVPVPSTAGLFDYNAANYKRGYVETYNFTIEERIRPGCIASAAYAGSQQKDPMNSLEENWSPIGTGTAGLLLNNAIDQRIASTPLLGTFGSVNYNALQARTQGRFSSGLTISVGYTWSKKLGFITPSSGQGGQPCPGYTEPLTTAP
jgi:hypothetical protein